MRTANKKLFSYAISIFFVLTSLKAASAGILPEDYKGQNVTFVNTSYTESQTAYKFPEDNPTSRKYVRYKRVFHAYMGRGTLAVENHGAQTAEIYVNGYNVPIDNVLSSENHTASIDIGKYTKDGKNSLLVVNITPDSSYINVKVLYPELVYGEPEDIGVNHANFNTVDKFINAEVEQGFPGAALIVVKDGRIIKNTAYGTKMEWDGFQKVNNPEIMTTDTMFDLASNTKMFAANLALMRLVSEGKINLSDLVSNYLDNFEDGPDDPYTGKAAIMIKDLMHHCAGFPSGVNYYNPQKAGDLYSQDKETTIEMLSKTPLVYEPGTKTLYSDIDYMILGAVVEKVTGMPLDQYVENNIYKPLGLTHTVFNPLKKGFKAEECAATERNGNTRDGSVSFPNVRTNVIRGQVHDENSYYSMGGVSGHAGLFSTTHDLAVLSQLILNGGGYGGFKLCDKNTLNQFLKPSDDNDLYGLGWDRNADYQSSWKFGSYASDFTIGHTGWTGTVTSIDPETDTAVILLTNKKNTPCPNGVFDSDAFETGKYGSIMTLVQEALLNTCDDNEAGLVQAAKDQLEIVKKSNNILDAKEAQAVIQILSDGAIKDQLTYELFLCQITVDPAAASSKAADMVRQAESSLKQSDRDIAEKYVEALPDGAGKDTLRQELKNI